MFEQEPEEVYLPDFFFSRVFYYLCLIAALWGVLAIVLFLLPVLLAFWADPVIPWDADELLFLYFMLAWLVLVVGILSYLFKQLELLQS